MNRGCGIFTYGWIAVALLAAGCSGEPTGGMEAKHDRALIPAVYVSRSAAFSHDSVGFFLTGETSYTAYPGAPANGGVLIKANGVWKANPTTGITDMAGRLYAWYPSDLALTPDAAAGNHTVPVAVSASQTSMGDAWQSATDYLYGSGSETVGSAAPVAAGGTVSDVTIYMQHAMAQVIFNVQYESRDASDNNYVKKITLSAPDAPFFAGDGDMSVADGTLAGLDKVASLSFAPVAGNEQAVGEEPVTVASGLVAPLDDVPAVTVTVVMGLRGNDAADRTYTLASSAVNVKWERGRRYIYNIRLGNSVSVSHTAVAWNEVQSGTQVSTVERGIGSAAELAAFAQKWKENGDKGTENAEFYKDYGWEEIDGSGNKTFTIKLIKSFSVVAVINNDVLWQPVGTSETPLNIPFDGQGWTINIDLTGIGGATTPIGRLEGTYVGIIGYTKKDIRNVCVVSTGLSGNVLPTIQYSSAQYGGVLAGRVDGNIVNCTVECGNITLSNTVVNSANAMYFGGMVGYCGGVIRNSAVFPSRGRSLSIGFSKASAGSCVGGLAGRVEGGVNNCYAHVTSFYNNASSVKPVAGILAGAYSGAMSNSHYISGYTLKNCTESAVVGTAHTDYSGIAGALNTVAAANSWEQWTEKVTVSGTSQLVDNVHLFEYREGE